ncbi:protein takeout-like isoform X2 [Euwallacea fornicatus]|uniref:protein takeout-like isoform X2 n=1 Tax=Euwallacea fornicatus TaxID=995702 RepID=UPI00338E2C7B
MKLSRRILTCICLTDVPFPTCKVQDSDFETCLNLAIEQAIRMAKNGLPEYNIPPLDPIKLSALSVAEGSGVVEVTQDYEDITVFGFSNLKINKSHVDLEKKSLEFWTVHPEIRQKAKYRVKGKILMLPVYGNGNCSLFIVNSYTKHLIKFEETNKGESVYFTPKSYQIKMIPEHASYIFENLFNGNKLLGDNINKVINQEWRTIFNEVGAAHHKLYAELFLEFTKNVFEKHPINDIFLR